MTRATLRLCALCVLLCAAGCREEPDPPTIVFPDEPDTAQGDTAPGDTAGTGAPTADEIDAGAGILEDALRSAPSP